MLVGPNFSGHQFGGATSLSALANCKKQLTPENRRPIVEG
jgi:hypothetical protein